MASALDQDREERPAYARFETVAIEDKVETLKQGIFVAKNVDYALITPPYSKDVMKYKVSNWFPMLEQEVKNGRMPAAWLTSYRESYEAYQKGNELPVDGTPIRTWAAISPAEIMTLVKMNIHTIEDLSLINDEGMKRIGMGGADLKNKALAHLSQADGTGPLTLENADLKKKLTNAEGVIKNQEDKIASLSRRLEVLEKGLPDDVPDGSGEIDASDVLEDDPPAKVNRTKKG